MNKLKAKLIVTLTAAMTVVSAFAPMTVRAADIPPATVSVGDWAVATVARSGSGWQIESYKLDRGLVVWTEINSSGTSRHLYAYDGAKTHFLAGMPASTWTGDPSGFVAPVTGDYDVADGLVVWLGSDGNDREVYSFDGESVKRVSDNSYDDRHPVTGNGRVAWTSQPNAGGAYNLMIKDASGIKRLASWHVPNYAFSGNTLYWLNKNPGEDWFRVFRNDGAATVAVGEGDDRPMSSYFLVDGKGSAAWEYSTKNWSYDKRVISTSVRGIQAVRLLQRDVPPFVTYLEDFDDGKVILNTHDLLYTRIIESYSLLEVGYGIERTISRKDGLTKVRYMDGGYVAAREPGVNIALVYHGATEEFVSADPVILGRFDADGASAAAARVGGGVSLYTAGKANLVASSVEANDIVVRNGDVAWTEGIGSAKVLKFATSKIMVKESAGMTSVSGGLVKAAGSPAVYLAADNGKRYVFPAEAQFYDWYADFSSVRTVSASTLAAMPVGGTVLFRPGTHVVKTASSPRVYAIGQNATINWVTGEDTLIAVFGADWKSKLVTIPETQLADYAFGEPITGTLAYYATLARKVSR